MRLAIIGVGGQAKKHIDTIVQNTDVEICAICDSNMIEAKKASTKLNCNYYTNYKELIDSEEIDVIFLSVPHNLHKTISIYALENKINVIKEKPFANNIKDANEMIETARKYNKNILTICQRRYHKPYIDGKELLSDLGEIYLVEVKYMFNGPPYNYGWRGVKEIAGGGAVLDMGYHILDILTWYFGLPISTYALASNKGRPDVYYDTEDMSTISMKYNSFVANVILNRVTNPKEEYFVVYGSKGILRVSRSEVTFTDVKGNLISYKSYNKSFQNAFELQLHDYINILKSKKYDYGESQLNNMILIKSIYESVEKNNKNDITSSIEERMIIFNG